MRSSDRTKGADKELGLREVLQGFGGLLRNRTLMMLSVSSSFRAATQGSLLVFVPIYLIKIVITIRTKSMKIICLIFIHK